LAGAFLAGAFLAGAFLAGAFLAGAFLAGAFLAGAFLADFLITTVSIFSNTTSFGVTRSQPRIFIFNLVNMIPLFPLIF
jgi:uncharacterized protein YjbI with pentapeptide repeats